MVGVCLAGTALDEGAMTHRVPSSSGRPFVHRVSAVFAAGVLAACGGGDSGADASQNPRDAGQSHDAGHKDAGAAHKDSGAGKQDAGVAGFKSTACADFSLTGMSASGVECGWVTVPEDHTKSGGKTLDLPVAVLKATGPSPAKDAVVFIPGGPGGGAIDRVTDRWGSEVYPLWRENRDVILFDPRGTGFNQPKLDCPEYAKQFTDNLAQKLSPSEDIDNLVAALRSCHDRLVGDGVDLGVYTSAQIARDVAEIIHALGYTSYNVYGISAGTRVALTIVRDVPEGVRSVVLDSPPAIAGPIVFAKDAEYGFKALFAACAADAKCAQAYPDLEQTMIDTVAKLDANPVSVGGTPPTAIVSGTRYLLALWDRLWLEAFARVPPLIMDAAQGKPPVYPATTDLAYGMSYSVLCSEEYPFDTKTHAADLAGVDSPYVSLDQFDFQTEGACKFWTVRPPDPKEDEAIVSDLPTLILSGSLDPIAPHYYADQIAETLSKSQHLLFENFGHGILLSNVDKAAPSCAQNITRAFLDAPTAPVDSSCQKDLPQIAWDGAM